MPKADGKTIAQRLKARYLIDAQTGCWEWQAGRNGKGYPYIWTTAQRRHSPSVQGVVRVEIRKGPEWKAASPHLREPELHQS